MLTPQRTPHRKNAWRAIADNTPSAALVARKVARSCITPFTATPKEPRPRRACRCQRHALALRAAQRGHANARLSDQFGNRAAQGIAGKRAVAMTPPTICRPEGCPAPCAVHPADAPALHGGGLASASGSLGGCRASRRIRKALGWVHGVVGRFHLCPPPPVVTAPTIA